VLKEISIKETYLETFLWFVMLMLGLGESPDDGEAVNEKGDLSMEKDEL
jgi:hypothetical protein